MSNPLAANRMLGLIDALKANIEDIGSRANKLQEEAALTLAREGRRHEAAVEEQAKQLSAAILKAEAAAQEAREAARARFEKRKEWIGRAYQSSREQALKQIDERVGGRRYELQKTMLQAEKDREAGLASITAASRDFNVALSAENNALGNLERSAQSMIKGYGGYRRLFLSANE